jgi:predicted CoA-binding protein
VHVNEPDDETIRRVLGMTRRIALVGASWKSARPAYGIQALLQRAGYDVTPVNPGLAGRTLHGQMTVATLDEAVPLDMIDVFRASVHLPGIVDDAIRLGARTLWTQLGVVDRAAGARAEAAGITVVMDRCPSIEMRRLGVGPR